VIQTVYGIACRQLQKWTKPVRDSLYRAYIRTFPCCACGQSWWVDAAHTGPHALGSKASDLNCIPLCRKCHEAYDKAPKEFAYQHNKMDVEELAQFFQHCYRTEFPERFQEPVELPTPAAEKKEAA
jgi:hypothetical protein